MPTIKGYGKMQLTKKEIVLQLILAFGFLKESEFENRIEFYKVDENLIVEELPTYNEYIEIFNNHYDTIIKTHIELLTNIMTFSSWLRNEDKENEYKVSEIITKAKQCSVFDESNFNGFNSGIKE